MRHRDLTLLKRIRRPVGYDRRTVGKIDESVTRVWKHLVGIALPGPVLVPKRQRGSVEPRTEARVHRGPTEPLLSLPFIVFLVPIIGPSLHHARATAYDMRGMLCPQLSVYEMKQLIKLRKEMLVEQEPHLRRKGPFQV